MARNQPRGLEIQAWMDSRNVKTEDVVILDDDADMAHLSHRLIRTSFNTGLTSGHVDAAIALFRYQRKVVHVIAACALIGLLLSLIR